MFDRLEKSSKTEDRYAAISDLQNKEKCVYFGVGIGN